MFKKLFKWVVLMAHKYERFIKFCLVGTMNAVLSILIYNGLLFLKMSYTFAYSISYVLTLINAFYWNGTHVFKASSKMAMIKYFIVYGVSFLVGQLILYLLIDILGWNKTLAQFPVIAIGTVINYTGSRLWAFKKAQNKL